MSCPAHQLANERGMLASEDVDLVRAAIAQLSTSRLVRVVDIGYGAGTVSLAVLSERADKIALTAIDRRPVCKESPQLGEGSTFEFVEADVAEVAFRGKIDLLLIDCAHTAEVMRAVMTHWLPRVRNGGHVWAHDYYPPSTVGWPQSPSPGVAEVIDEAVARGTLKHVESRGLGWLGVKCSPKQ